MQKQDRSVQELDTDIHIRIPVQLVNQLQQIAESYAMKKSSLARIILLRHVNDYSRNRLFIWECISESRQNPEFAVENFDVRQRQHRFTKSLFISHKQEELSVKELEQIKKHALLVKEFSSNTKSQVIAYDNGLGGMVKR